MGHGVSCMCWRDGGVDAGCRRRGRAWTELNDDDEGDDDDAEGAEAPCEVRVALVGDTGVGKTTLARRFLEGPCEDDSRSNSSTIGVEWRTKTVRQDGRAYRVAVVDCGGRRKYERLAQGFLARCDVALVAYDAGCGDTLAAAAAWARTWRRSRHFADCPWVLLALKCDGVCVPSARAQALAAAEGACGVRCASARTGRNVDAVFAEALRIAADGRARRNDTACLHA